MRMAGRITGVPLPVQGITTWFPYVSQVYTASFPNGGLSRDLRPPEPAACGAPRFERYDVCAGQLELDDGRAHAHDMLILNAAQVALPSTKHEARLNHFLFGRVLRNVRRGVTP